MSRFSLQHTFCMSNLSSQSGTVLNKINEESMLPCNESKTRIYHITCRLVYKTQKERKKKKKKRCTATQNGIFPRTVTVKTMADNIYQRNFPAECLSSYNLNLGFVFPSTTLQPEASNEHQEEVETT